MGPPPCPGPALLFVGEGEEVGGVVPLPPDPALGLYGGFPGPPVPVLVSGAPGGAGRGVMEPGVVDPGAVVPPPVPMPVPAPAAPPAPPPPDCAQAKAKAGCNVNEVHKLGACHR